MRRATPALVFLLHLRLSIQELQAHNADVVALPQANVWFLSWWMWDTKLYRYRCDSSAGQGKSFNMAMDGTVQGVASWGTGFCMSQAAKEARTLTRWDRISGSINYYTLRLHSTSQIPQAQIQEPETEVNFFM